MKQNSYDLIIIGAGPAGLIAAGRAAELGLKVLILEKMERPGRKLLITGKGRCNISNDSPMDVYFKNIFPKGRFLKHAFHNFFSEDIVKLLNDHGLVTQTERGNRIFPVNNKASDVLKAIMKWLGKYPVTFKFHSRVEELLIQEGEIKGVKTFHDDKEITYHSKSVLISTGGKSYPATGSSGDGYSLAKKCGHTIIEARPALVPLVSSGNTASNLQGLSLKNINAVVWVNGKKVAEEFGEMMFAHFGLTGPVILSLSRLVVDELRAKNKVQISIDLKPALDEQKLDKRLLRDLESEGKKHIENIFKLWMPQKLITVILEKAGISGEKEGHQISAKERRKILYILKNLQFEIIDFRGFKEAIITAGGISSKDINGKTMESKIIKNLYFAGEVIDLDANTGGYNLQIAYSTGWLAAESIHKGKTEKQF